MKGKMEWRSRLGHLMCPTKLEGVFRLKDDSTRFYVRARKKDERKEKPVEVSRFVKAATPEEAFATLQELLSAAVEPAKVQAPTFTVYARELLKRKLAIGDIKSKAGQNKWEVILEEHLVPAFGAFYMDRLERRDVVAWLEKMGGLVKTKDYKPSTVNGWLSVLRVICNTATVELDLDRNPVELVKPLDCSEHPTYTEESPNSIPPVLVGQFLELMLKHHPKHYGMTVLGLATGLRPSSLRPLRRTGPQSDINWDEGFVLVRRSQTIGDEVMERTKTGARQKIYLPREVLKVLRWHCDTQLSLKQLQTDLLFPSASGGFRARSVLDKPFHEVSQLLGLGYDLTAKALRRSANDAFRQAGVSPTTMASLTGHTTDSMRALYATVSATEQRKAIRQAMPLAGLLGPSAGILGGKESAASGIVLGPEGANYTERLEREKGFEPSTSTLARDPEPTKPKPSGSLRAGRLTVKVKST